MPQLTLTALEAARATYARAETVYKWAHEESAKDPENEFLRDVKGETYAVYDLAFQALRAAEQAHKYATPAPTFTGTLPPAQISQIEGDEGDRL